MILGKRFNTLPLPRTNPHQMILDKRFNGILDAGAGCLNVYPPQASPDPTLTLTLTLALALALALALTLTPTPTITITITNPSPGPSPSPDPDPNPTRRRARMLPTTSPSRRSTIWAASSMR